MLNEERQAGTTADSKVKMRRRNQSADITQMPLLAAGYPKSLSAGLVRLIAIGICNGYEVVNEFLPKETGEGFYFNSWHLLSDGAMVCKRKGSGKFDGFYSLKTKEEALQLASSLPACR